MQLITPLLPLLQGGVVLTLRMSAAAGQNIQLDILPQGKDTATGVALAPRALLGTAQELDEHLEAYLQKYATSLTRLADIVAGADAELQAIEEAASAQARKAVAERRRSRTSAKTGSAHANRLPAADDDGDGDDDDDDDDDDDAPLLSTPASSTAGNTTPPAGTTPGDGISHKLFVS